MRHLVGAVLFQPHASLVIAQTAFRALHFFERVAQRHRMPKGVAAAC
ncbi:MAG: hypothetical protein BWZ10_00669 [candidate division BRC1 bacterium ADurb.BinA364]|nr:MAG: hypothetical protein BWZ10_00669 [candidate division BRC1 bacterium ADurb.BinA364]